jgi:hypothetical protein
MRPKKGHWFVIIGLVLYAGLFLVNNGLAADGLSDSEQTLVAANMVAMFTMIGVFYYGARLILRHKR